MVILHECATANACKAIAKRVETFNKGKSMREHVVGDKVLVRIPGMRGALQSSWEGLFPVVKKLSRVTYLIGMGKDGVGRLTHINNTKRYKDRVLSVSAVCVVAEESGEISQTVEKSKVLDSE